MKSLLLQTNKECTNNNKQKYSQQQNTTACSFQLLLRFCLLRFTNTLINLLLFTVSSIDHHQQWVSLREYVSWNVSRRRLSSPECPTLGSTMPHSLVMCIPPTTQLALHRTMHPSRLYRRKLCCRSTRGTTQRGSQNHNWILHSPHLGLNHLPPLQLPVDATLPPQTTPALPEERYFHLLSNCDKPTIKIKEAKEFYF